MANPTLSAVPNGTAFLSFDVKGPRDLRQDLENKVLQDELKELLHEAGFTGTFTVVGTRTVRGTPHTKGLRIHSPSFKGAVLTWHAGSNDRNIRFLILTPSLIVKDRMELHDRLTTAMWRINERRKAAQKEKRDETTTKAVSPETPAAPEPEESAKDQEVPVMSSMRESCVVDSDTGELLVSELLPHASSKGLVARRHIRDVLIALGFRKERMGPVFHSLIGNGHFEHADADGFMQIGLRWRKKYLPDSVQKEKKAEEQPGLAAEGFSLPAEPLDSVRSKSATGADATPRPVRQSHDPRVKLGRLLRLADEAVKHRKRLAEIAEERKRVEEITAIYAARLHDLETEAANITSALESPDLKNAEERLKSVQDQLNF